MNTRPPEQVPIVLVISGHDPSGGAGMLADCETIVSLDARPVGALTSVTAQNTQDAFAVWPLAADQVERQVTCLLDDVTVRAVKIGLLGTAAIAQTVARCLDTIDAPVVLDPVLVAASGARLAEEALVDVLLDELVPRAAIVTPNAHEYRRLAGTPADKAAGSLLDRGADAVLIKGGDEETPDVINRLYRKNAAPRVFESRRRPGQFHGSGCTLASAIAAFIAHGAAVDDAVEHALHYMDQAIEAATRPGKGQYVPNRRTYQREPA